MPEPPRSKIQFSKIRTLDETDGNSRYPVLCFVSQNTNASNQQVSSSSIFWKGIAYHPNKLHVPVRSLHALALPVFGFSRSWMPVIKLRKRSAYATLKDCISRPDPYTHSHFATLFLAPFLQALFPIHVYCDFSFYILEFQTALSILLPGSCPYFEQNRPYSSHTFTSFPLVSKPHMSPWILWRVTSVSPCHMNRKSAWASSGISFYHQRS